MNKKINWEKFYREAIMNNFTNILFYRSDLSYDFEECESETQNMLEFLGYSYEEIEEKMEEYREILKNICS